MSDDPRINWKLANPYGILTDESQNAWNSGLVTDVLELDGGDAGWLAATETAGVWTISPNYMTVPLSTTWNCPDVTCLAAGPDGSRHFFAGTTTLAPNGTVVEGASIYETDASSAVPLLNWVPVRAPLPAKAGSVNDIFIMRQHRRIIAACDGGLYWAEIPPQGPARPPYTWHRAEEEEKGQEGYKSVTVGSLDGLTEEPGSQDPDRVSVVAGGRRHGVFVGLWREPNRLVMQRVELLDGANRDMADFYFIPTNATAVAVCDRYPRFLYASCAFDDGTLQMILSSSDGGMKWQIAGFDLMNYPGQTDIRAVAGDQGNNRNNCIAVMPTDPGLVAFGWVPGVFLSPDSGRTWKLLSESPHLHDDIHALLFKPTTPDNRHDLYIASDGGLASVSLDDFLANGAVNAVSEYNRVLPALQCYATFVPLRFYGTLALSNNYPTKGWASVGLQDNSNVYSDLGAVTPWRRVQGGDGGWNGFADDGGLINNAESDAARAATWQASLLVDHGVVPISVPPDPKGVLAPVGDVVRCPGYRGPSGQLLSIVAGSGSNIYGLYRDPGSTTGYQWELLGMIPNGETVAGVASHTGATVFVGTMKGNLYALDTRQGTFLQLPVVLPNPDPFRRQSGGYPTRIVTLSETVAFAFLSNTNLKNNYVLRLDGLQWKPPTSIDLPRNEFFYGIDGAFQEDRTILFVCTDDRVYMSEDAGEHWVQASAGLPRRVHCRDLRISAGERDSWVYLGTCGHSVWRAPLNHVYYR